MENYFLILLNIYQKIVRKISNLFSSKIIYFKEFPYMPDENYPAKLDFEFQKYLFDKFSFGTSNRLYPGVTYNNLDSILYSLYSKSERFNFLDFGARNIDHYCHLNKNISNINYFYHDLPQYNETIHQLKKEKNIQNLNIINSIELLESIELDFIFLGSVLQYIKDYKSLLSKLFNLNADYFFLAGQICYEKKIENKDVFFFKQLNSLPQINYGQAFHYDSLIQLFSENGWKLITKSLNQTDKHLNFNHISKKYGKIDNLDFFFEKKS